MNEVIVNLTIESLSDESLKYFCKANNLNKAMKKDEKIINHCIELKNKYFKDTSIDILVTKFNNNHIKENYFLFGRDKVYCNVLEKINKNNIVCGIMYAFHAPDVKIREDNIEDILYIDSWQKSFNKACKDKLYELFNKQIISINSNLYISGSLEPGTYGIDPYSTKSFFKVCNGRKLNIKITKSDTLNPINSVVALNLILSKTSIVKVNNSNLNWGVTLPR